MRPIDRETWYRFIEAVEIEWLSLSKVSARHYINDVYGNYKVEISPLAMEARPKFLFDPDKHFHNWGNRVRATPEVSITYMFERHKILTVKANYDVLYSCYPEFIDEIDVSDELWIVFLEDHLPLAITPFFRELVQGIAGRMNIAVPPVPMFKVLG